MLDFNLPTAKYQEQIHQSSIPQTQEEFLIKAEIAGFDTHDLSAFNAYIYIYSIYVWEIAPRFIRMDFFIEFPIENPTTPSPAWWPGIYSIGSRITCDPLSWPWPKNWIQGMMMFQTSLLASCVGWASSTIGDGAWYAGAGFLQGSPKDAAKDWFCAVWFGRASLLMGAWGLSSFRLDMHFGGPHLDWGSLWMELLDGCPWG